MKIKTKIVTNAITQANEIIDFTKETNELPSKLVKISADIDSNIKEVRELVSSLYTKVKKEVSRKWDKVPLIGGLLGKFSSSVFDRALSVDELVDTVLEKLNEYQNKLTNYKDVTEEIYNYLLVSKQKSQTFLKKYEKTFNQITLRKEVTPEKQKEIKFFAKYYQTIKTIDSVLSQLLKQNDVVLESLDGILMELITTKTVTKSILMSTLTQMAIQITQKEALDLIKDTRQLHELALEASGNLAEENFQLLKELDQETFIKVTVIKNLMEKLENLSRKYKELEKESVQKFRENVKQLDKILTKFDSNQNFMPKVNSELRMAANDF